MANVANKTDGPKDRRSDSKTETGKSTAVKPESNLAFTLAAGAVGLGITLLEQQQAEAAVWDGDLNLDLDSLTGTLSFAMAEEIAAGAGPSAALGQMTYDGQSVAVASLGEKSIDPAALKSILELAQPTDAAAAAGDPANSEGDVGEVSATAMQSPVEEPPAEVQVASAGPIQTGSTASSTSSQQVGSGGRILHSTTEDSDPLYEAIPITIDTLNETPVLGIVSPVTGAVEAVGGIVGGVGGAVEGVGGLVTGLLGGDEESDGLLPDVGEAVGDIVGGVGGAVDGVLDGVGGLVTGLLGGDEESDGPLPEVGETVGDIVGEAGGVVDGVLGGVGGVVTGLFGGVASAAATSEASPTSTASSSADTAEASVNTVTSSSDSGQLQPDIFEAVGQVLQLTDGLLGALVPKVTFIGQSSSETDDHHDGDNPHGSLFHGLI